MIDISVVEGRSEHEHPLIWFVLLGTLGLCAYFLTTRKFPDAVFRSSALCCLVVAAGMLLLLFQDSTAVFRTDFPLFFSNVSLSLSLFPPRLTRDELFAAKLACLITCIWGLWFTLMGFKGSQNPDYSYIYVWEGKRKHGKAAD